jgi:peptide deformylase
MIRPILKCGAAELTRKSAPVTVFDGQLKTLVRDMFETMYDAPGIGLAAVQIGVDMRLVVMDVSGGQELGRQLVLANPELVSQEGVQREEEGCLSIPDFTAIVERPYRVKVAAQDLEGRPIEVEGEGILARALCHEIDHTNGILYLDRISPLKRELIKRKIRKLVKAGEW